LSSIYERDYLTLELREDHTLSTSSKKPKPLSAEKIPKKIEELRKQMLKASKKLEFERAAELRDEILVLEKLLMQIL
jgi:excinuclease ABC subunit B